MTASIRIEAERKEKKKKKKERKEMGLEGKDGKIVGYFGAAGNVQGSLRVGLADDDQTSHDEGPRSSHSADAKPVASL